MENIRESTLFRKLLRLVPPKLRNWLHPQFEETNKKKLFYTSQCFSNKERTCQQYLASPLGQWFSLTLKSERKMAIYCTPCPLHYGGCGSLARKKGELWLLGLLQTGQMASCFWFRSLPWARATNMLIFSVCLCYLSTTPSPHHWNTSSERLDPEGVYENTGGSGPSTNEEFWVESPRRCLPRIIKLRYVPEELILSFGRSDCEKVFPNTKLRSASFLSCFGSSSSF